MLWERERAVSNRDLTALDLLNIFGVFLQTLNYQSDLSQESNADLARHLQNQDKKYLERILENQNRIISILEESKATK